MTPASLQAGAGSPLAWPRFEPEGIQIDVARRCRAQVREISWLPRA